MDKNLADILCDENNTDPIVLYSEKGEAITFEQIAVIPLENQLFAILRPLETPEGMAEDEALVFALTESDGEMSLEIQMEDAVIDAVFDKYNQLLEESGIS